MRNSYLVAKGLSRTEIAKRTGISVSSVQRILRNQTNQTQF
ncbi:helix-turn-helix domain-containing protein [Aeromonas veronii]